MTTQLDNEFQQVVRYSFEYFYPLFNESQIIFMISGLVELHFIIQYPNQSEGDCITNV